MLSRTLSISILGSIVLLRSASAVDVTNWSISDGSGILSASDTNDPVVGSGATDSASNEAIYAAIAGVPTQLSAPGERLTLAGTVVITGSASGVNQFRWGLYDVNGKTGVSGWQGYFPANAVTSTGGDLRERNSPNGANFWDGASTTVLTTSAGAGAAFSPGTYAFTLSLERTIASELQIGWTLTRAAAYSQAGSFLDVSPSTFTFDRVGFWFGGSLDADQAAFQDVTVTHVPEPSSLLLLIAAAGLISARRRRS